MKTLEDLWEYAPKWANWLAQSPSGWVHYYENKPVLEYYGWVVSSGKGGNGVFRLIEVDWRNSLRHHPLKSKGHIHAELMVQYAEDALTNEKPWELWEIKDIEGQWVQLDCSPAWHVLTEYRRKPKTILIGDVEVPEPLRGTLEVGDLYWTPNLLQRGGKAKEWYWNGSKSDLIRMSNGFIHDNEEAAVRHALALIKISGGEL